MTHLDNYRKIKTQYPDYVILYRIGDFYEALDDDARKFAEAADVVLTTRTFDGKTRTALAGVPYHSVTQYVDKLIRAGYKVALAEQTNYQQEWTASERRIVPIVAQEAA